MSNPQQRAHERVAVVLSADIAVGRRRFTAITKNLSVGGCCIEGAYPLPEGSEVALRLFVVVDGIEDAGMPAMAMTASVQWHAEAEAAPLACRHLAGLRFDGASSEQRGWLEAFLLRDQAA